MQKNSVFMSLEKKLFFRFNEDVSVKFEPILYRHSETSKLCLLKLDLYFPSGVSKKGGFIYDLDKQGFIGHLTDNWEFPIEPSYLICNPDFASRCKEYKTGLSLVIDALLQLDVLKIETYSVSDLK